MAQTRRDPPNRMGFECQRQRGSALRVALSGAPLNRQQFSCSLIAPFSRSKRHPWPRGKSSERTSGSQNAIRPPVLVPPTARSPSRFGRPRAIPGVRSPLLSCFRPEISVLSANRLQFEQSSASTKTRPLNVDSHATVCFPAFTRCLFLDSSRSGL